MKRFSMILVVFLLFTTAQASAASKKPAMQLLFVIEAKHAVLKHELGKEFTLTIRRADVIDSVLAFSDRPYRKTFRINLANYEELVHAGKGSFMKVNPNVVLSWVSHMQPAQAFLIKEHTMTKSTVTFRLIGLGDVPAVGKTIHIDRLSVYVDGYNLNPKYCQSKPGYRGIHTFYCGLVCGENCPRGGG